MDTTTINIKRFMETWTPPKRDHTRVPDADWTGHQYKAPQDCHVTNWDHVGRESTAAKRMAS